MLPYFPAFESDFQTGYRIIGVFPMYGEMK